MGAQAQLSANRDARTRRCGGDVGRGPSRRSGIARWGDGPCRVLGGTVRHDGFHTGPNTDTQSQRPDAAAALSAVRDAVASFRQAIESRRAADPPTLQREGSALYEALVAPIEDLIANSARIVIVADGPLTSLPFASLVRHGDRSDRHYFIEWKPLLVAPSAATYVLLRSRPQPTASQRFVLAVGNPVTGADAGISSRRSEDSADPEGASGESDEESFVPRTSARGGSLPGGRRGAPDRGARRAWRSHSRRR